jgi:outer membrane protein TolC
MKKIILTIAGMLLIFSGHAQLTLDQCQEKSKANYPLIKQYDLISKSTDYSLSNANKAYLPQVSVTGIGAYVISGLPSFSLPGAEPKASEDFKFIGIAQINQVIWDGGATHTQKDIAKAKSEVDKANVDVSFYSIRERVNQIYFGILIIDEQLKQLAVLQENLERNLANITLTQANGLAYQSDVDEVKSELQSVEQKKIEFSYARKGYVDMLSYLTGQPLNEGVTLEKPVTAESVSVFTMNRPELKLFSSQVKLIEANASLNKVLNMPKFGVLGIGALIEPGISLGTSTLSSVALAGVSMSWNTSGIYKISTTKKLEKVQSEMITNQQEAFVFGNNLQLKQVSSEIEKQKEIMGRDTEIVTLKNNIKRACQLKYDNGMCSMSDLINSINKESEARCNMALHNVQLLMSIYNYKTISGN